MEYLISHLLTNVLGPQLLPRAPWDPYARGNVVPPMKTAQKRSAERYEIALWANRAYNPDFGNMTGIVRTTVPIWGNEHAAGASTGRFNSPSGRAPACRSTRGPS